MAIKIYRQNTSAASAAPPNSLNYGEMACSKDGTIYVGNSDNDPVSRVSYAVSSGTANSATTATTATNATGVTGNIKGYSILNATSDHYAWWLSYGGTGSYGGAKKYFACVHADQADFARASNISMSYNGNLYISYS
jgi:hypothetical protein